MAARHSSRRTAADPVPVKSELHNRKRSRSEQPQSNTQDRDEAGPSNAPSNAPSNRAADAQVRQMHDRIDAISSNARQKMQALTTQAVQQRVKDAVNKVARCVLFKWHSSPNQPISIKQLNDVVNSCFTHGAPRGTAPLVIMMAQAKIAATFGLELQEFVNVTKNSKKKDESAGAKSYILKTMIPDSFREKYLSELAPAMNYEMQALLCVIMTLISINSDQLPEENMWQELAALGVEKDQRHPLFGKVPEALDTLIKQKLLRHERRAGGPHGAGESWFEVGEHGKVLVDTHYVVEFMKQVLHIQQP